ncbi:MAG: RNA polymerase sigma factor [Balneolaceae bacterium]
MLHSFKNTNPPGEHYFVPFDNFKHFSDEEIIKKVIEGSTPLFEVIMRRYNQRLYRIQRSYLLDEDAIKDTMQITYIKVFENLHKFRGESRFSTWITRIAINEALKYIDREKRYTELHIVDEDKQKQEQTMKEKNTPEEIAIQDDLKNILEKTVNRLPVKYRSVYMMREVEQMSTEETAGCLNISQANVKVRLHRAKNMVREDLEKSVADTEIFNFLGKECDQIVYRVMNIINQD